MNFDCSEYNLGSKQICGRYELKRGRGSKHPIDAGALDLRENTSRNVPEIQLLVANKI